MLLQDCGRWRRSHLGQGNRFSFRQLEQVVVIRLLKIIVVNIQRRDVEIVPAGEVIGKRTCVRAGPVHAPNPDQIVQAMIIHQPVEQLAVECRRAATAAATAPPKPFAIHFVVGPPQHRNVRRLKLFEKPGNDIHLGAPVIVQSSAGRDHIVPLFIRELALHAGELVRRRSRLRPERDRLIRGGRHGMPAQGDDGALLVLPLDLRDDFRPGGRRVLVAGLGETEILAENGRDLPAHFGRPLSGSILCIRIVMLAGERVFAGNTVNVIQQRHRFRRGIGRHRPDGTAATAQQADQWHENGSFFHD